MKTNLLMARVLEQTMTIMLNEVKNNMLIINEKIEYLSRDIKT